MTPEQMRELEFIEELFKATVDGRLGWNESVSASYLTAVGSSFLKLHIDSRVRLYINNEMGDTIRSYSIENEEIAHLHEPLKALAFAVQNDGAVRIDAIITELRSRKVPK